MAAYRKSVAWIPQQITPMPGLTVREQVAYAGWLKGMPKDLAWKASEDALRRVDLTRLAERKSHQVSGGQLRPAPLRPEGEHVVGAGPSLLEVDQVVGKREWRHPLSKICVRILARRGRVTRLWAWCD
ncbi:hypothetical protein ACIA6C_32350 [Streptomyces sp. NPDC051578]|uniref:hypothetical protein n=1 Tax=Streptomyces sp. NPDC051578 TaxID=3365662 RepID=UPI0037AF1658